VDAKAGEWADADKALKDFVSKYRSRLIPDDLSATTLAGLNQGHRQTTDSYFAVLAKHHGIKLARFEEALAKRFPEVSEWVKLALSSPHRPAAFKSSNRLANKSSEDSAIVSKTGLAIGVHLA
jgi:hypothetical protein